MKSIVRKFLRTSYSQALCNTVVDRIDGNLHARSRLRRQWRPEAHTPDGTA